MALGNEPGTVGRVSSQIAAVQGQRKRLSSGGLGIAARRQLGNFQCPGRYPANRSSTTTNENSATHPPQMTPTECPTGGTQQCPGEMAAKGCGEETIDNSLPHEPQKKVSHIPYQRKYEVMTLYICTHIHNMI